MFYVKLSLHFRTQFFKANYNFCKKNYFIVLSHFSKANKYICESVFIEKCCVPSLLRTRSIIVMFIITCFLNHCVLCKTAEANLTALPASIDLNRKYVVRTSYSKYVTACNSTVLFLGTLSNVFFKRMSQKDCMLK